MFPIQCHIRFNQSNTFFSLKSGETNAILSFNTTTDLKSSTVRQETRFLSVKTGEELTLQCFYEGDVAVMLYWYKQTLGQKPKLISTYHEYNINGIFHDEFKNNSRFTLDMENGKNHLKITDVRVSDSATYYCASSDTYTYIFEFAEGTVVDVKGSGLNVRATVHQSASESIQPGGSVTLNCTVHTGTCDGEHSVYWFKNSEESQPGLIYTHGDRNDQCERKPNTQTHSCVYNLPMKSLNLSHAGTYYCAVASCGHVLFGDRTKLELEDEVDSPFLVYFLSAALAFTTILSVLLAFLMYKVNKRNSCQTADADNLHYAALSVNLPNRSRRQRNNTNNECVYSSVKQ
uniref:Ig-like domain-containing protein n=1 Tax=Sander lucioperca TaxID=283035 RepID=A0A8C9X4P6_SANLU